MKCEKCGKEFDHLSVDFFNREGADEFEKTCFFEEDDHAIVMDLNQNWTGYGLSEEEMSDTIVCPNCRQFPFIDKEIQVYEIVRVVCFKTDQSAEEEGSKVCFGL